MGKGRRDRGERGRGQVEDFLLESMIEWHKKVGTVANVGAVGGWGGDWGLSAWAEHGRKQVEDKFLEFTNEWRNKSRAERTMGAWGLSAWML